MLLVGPIQPRRCELAFGTAANVNAVAPVTGDAVATWIHNLSLPPAWQQLALPQAAHSAG